MERDHQCLVIMEAQAELRRPAPATPGTAPGYPVAVRSLPRCLHSGGALGKSVPRFGTACRYCVGKLGPTRTTKSGGQAIATLQATVGCRRIPIGASDHPLIRR